MEFIKENKYNILLVILLGVVPVVFFKSILFLTVLAVYLLIVYINRHRIKKSIYQLIALYVFHCLMLQLLYNKFFAATQGETFRFFISFMASSLVLIFPFILIFRLNNLFFDIFKPKEKRYAKLICTQHLTRTQPLFLEDGKIRIVCRIEGDCAKNKKLKYANNIIGVIGKNAQKPRKSKDFYVNLWNHSKKEVKHGDYDFIEIYQTNTIEDYNNVLSQMMAFFYNDLNGFKPMNEIVVEIFGNLNLTKSTQRLLEKNFKEVKYNKMP
jgi:hypothetical protein